MAMARKGRMKFKKKKKKFAQVDKSFYFCDQIRKNIKLNPLI